jgi:hypothetical protein
MKTRDVSLVISLLILTSFFVGCEAQKEKLTPIEWNETGKLSWDDYSATPNSEADESAVTWIYFDYSWECKNGKFTVTVKAFFDRQQSWVKAGDKSPELLQHEQGHFDLAEVFARRLKQSLACLTDPCGDLEATQTLFDQLVKANQDNFASEQVLYDQETGSGTNPSKQSEWDAKIANDLSALAAYK